MKQLTVGTSADLVDDGGLQGTGRRSRCGEEVVTVGGIDIEEDGGKSTAALVEPRQKKIENRVQVQVLEGRTTAVGGVLIATDRDLDLEHPSLDLEELLEDMVAVGVGRRRGSKARQVVKQTGRCGRVHSGKQNKSATMSPSSPSTLPPCPTLHPGTRAQP